MSRKEILLTAFFYFYVWTQVSVSDWTQTSLISSLTHRRFLTDETFKLEPTDISCWSRWSRRKIQRIFCVIDFHHLSISVCTKCFSNSLNSGHILFFPLQQTFASRLTKRRWTSPKMKWCHRQAEMFSGCCHLASLTTYVKVFHWSRRLWHENSLWLSGEARVRLNLRVGSVCRGVGQVEARRVFWFGRWTREKLQLLNSSWSCDDELLWQRISGEEV